ncbi:MAG: hypothetical protein CVU79_03005 [Elusimicrobia bacterium HGW-Elusimicrobia-3]|nr:MAG: hypothetical protein CVU79_03005 [Elusimicrobia bacterium HGW-Elusimicrobia-3]
MRKRALSFWLGLALTAAAMAAAVSAPAEVLNNLDFFSDYELLYNLELIESAELGSAVVSVSTAPALSTAAVTAPLSTGTVTASTATWRVYEKP